MTYRPWLLGAHPELSGLPYHRIGTYPSPLTPLERISRLMGASGIWVKRDDQISRACGGNKARKLEWLLGDALSRKAEAVLTLGVVGSNHVLATAIHGAAAGLRVEAVTFPGPEGARADARSHVAETHGAILHHVSRGAAVPWAVARRRLFARRNKTAYIAGGGSSAIGGLGYVDAAFELAHQIAEGVMPQPTAIFVAAGTGGTLAGLVLGCRLAGLRSRVVGVRVVDRLVCNRRAVCSQANATLSLLKKRGLKARVQPIKPADFTLLHHAFGDGYGIPTRASERATAALRELERVPLEPIYTGKAMNGLLSEVHRWKVFRDEPVLFWNTCSATR